MRLAVLVVLLAVPGVAADPLLWAVVPDLPGPGPGDEGVALWSSSDVDVEGWSLDDGEDVWVLPDVRLEGGEPFWITGDTSSWAAHGGEDAMEWEGMQLANEADGIRLLRPDGSVADEMEWGEEPLDYASPGLILQRDLRDGVPVDTDDASDWVTPRIHRMGMSDLDAPEWSVDRVTLYASPDSSFDVLTDLVARARTRLHLHVYEITSPALADALVQAKGDHPDLDLHVLVEGSPVGLSKSARAAMAEALHRVETAGGTAYLANDGRYRYHHLKVLVADDAVAVQSENWVPSGVPEDNSWGNRGWGAVLHDEEAADWFADWMADDRASWETVGFEVEAFDPGHEAPSINAARTGDYRRVEEPLVLDDVRVRPLVSPDHTGDPRVDPVARAIAKADERVLAQQLDLTVRATNRLGWSSADPLVDALAKAAESGVAVRVMAATPFSSEDEGSRPALAGLEAAGASTKEASWPGLATLHNKGVIADDVVILGSMNGNHNSRSANREVGLILDDERVADYYADLFESDWDAGASGSDWSVIEDDLEAIPALAPILFLAVAVGLARRRR